MKNKDIKISIIVPFYNSANTLDRCIKSLLEQDVEELQFILVDDGSSDQSLQIAQNYTKEDSRFLVLTQPNRGQGAARNNGIRNAAGKYILLVDSDDYLDSNILGKMLERAEEENLDILTGELRHINEEGREYYFPLNNRNVLQTGRECLMSGGVCYSLCSHMYKREFLLKNSLLMMEGVRYEDMDYCIRTAWLANRVMNTDIVFYNYMVHDSSVSNGNSFDIVEDYYKVAERVADFVDVHVDEEAFEVYFREYLGFLYSHMVNICITKGFKVSRLLGDKVKREKILYYLKNAGNKRYYIQYLLLTCRLYGVYGLLYKMKKQ